MSKGITSRSENYSEWYNDLVRKGGLAEHSDVRGCMVIKPYGFALWENMKAQLDTMFKDTGHVNAYFPLFIPKSYLSREADHVEGFAKECAVVTHYRLKNAEDGSGVIVDPAAKLEEELIVRPTSETIIWSTYKKWIQSYRDLPLLINQWANVVRWEMRTRLFLRTAEFLWQEGHTAHATEQEAIEEAEQMLHVYADFVEQYLAIPVMRGVKTESERFAGAVETYCIEALMQDGKALQAGTSHFLGQNFAKAFDVKFADKENKEEYVWATSWGVSTRLVGALIMAHSDDEGLVLPPKMAPYHAVLLPMLRKNDPEFNETMINKAKEMAAGLKKAGLRIKIDTDETKRPGFKYAAYELQGYPMRVVVGPRDLENNQVEVARRDTKEKFFVGLDELEQKLVGLVDEIHDNMYAKAKAYQESHVTEANTWEEFQDILDNKGGFVSAHWDGTNETEDKIKEATKATIRCIPLNNQQEAGQCIFSGKPSTQRVLFAKAY
ncbi:MAG: proline--tRNA ligase [Saprospiraceae bacterium]|nr:proline--tRNA ligase [Saprospiraceae bacterium]